MCLVHQFIHYHMVVFRSFPLLPSIYSSLLPSSSPTQELTEEGLPLLLLFYNPDDTSVKELFKERIEAEIADQKGESTITDVL